MLDAGGARRMMAYLILIVRMLGTSGSRWDNGDTGVHRVHTGCAGRSRKMVILLRLT